MDRPEQNEVRLTIGLTPELHRLLTRLSVDERRSLRQEIVWLLERHPIVEAERKGQREEAGS